MQKIICLVGDPASGKGAVVKYLAENGFSTLSLSEEVRKHTRELLGHDHIPRAEMGAIANQARQEHGPGYFAQPIISNEVFTTAPLLVVDSIRNLAELDLIRDHLIPTASLQVWAITADSELRFQRISSRKYPWDPQTYAEFKQVDIKELGSTGEQYSQQNAACIEAADITFYNNGTLDELKTQIETQLFKDGILEGPQRRGKETW